MINYISCEKCKLYQVFETWENACSASEEHDKLHSPPGKRNYITTVGIHKKNHVEYHLNWWPSFKAFQYKDGTYYVNPL